MNIGLIKEIKIHEYRVGLTPENAKLFCEHGHTVFVEKSAGVGAGFEDALYNHAGCTITADKGYIFDNSEMIVKVKEPIEEEYELFHERQILYTYLHLAANRPLTEALSRKKVTGIAYETITGSNGTLPCLIPMSEIAGRLSIQEGAKYLEKPFGGRGVLLGGVPGVPRGNVVIIGGGIVGANACKMAVGLHANVTILDLSHERLAYLDDLYGPRISTLYSSKINILNAIKEADLTIGAVLIPGGAAPKLITKADLKLMKPNSVIVDVAIDQGGCCESSHITYHDNPTFLEEGVLHYCVGNMPGAVALTSTYALTSNTISHGLAIADKGVQKALQNQDLLNGLNTYDGKCTKQPVAENLGLDFVVPSF